jgi:hypothetical protein
VSKEREGRLIADQILKIIEGYIPSHQFPWARFRSSRLLPGVLSLHILWSVYHVNGGGGGGGIMPTDLKFVCTMVISII